MRNPTGKKAEQHKAGSPKPQEQVHAECLPGWNPEVAVPVNPIVFIFTPGVSKGMARLVVKLFETGSVELPTNVPLL